MARSIPYTYASEIGSIAKLDWNNLLAYIPANYLKLDQTTPQHVINGLPNFDSGLVVPKTSGLGIKVDTVSPTFGYRDLLGTIVTRGVGASDPDWAVFRDTIYQYKFSNGHLHEAWIDFHMPHDYVPNTDMFIHVHWTQNVVDTGGAAGVPGVAKWYFDISYADGYGIAGGVADPFSAIITTSVAQQGSTTRYGHMIAEVQFTNGTGDASHILNTRFKVDGIIKVRVYRDNSDVGDTLNEEPFVPFVDCHYQTNGVMGTKSKNTPFYS